MIGYDKVRGGKNGTNLLYHHACRALAVDEKV